MKLHQTALESKQNIPQYYSVLHKIITNSFRTIRAEACSRTNITTEIYPTFFDITDREVNTPILEDNVLVFGHNPEWNQRAAFIIKDAFADSGKKAEIITVKNFLSIEDGERRNNNICYIIICNDIYLSAKKLSTLKSFTSTCILFKLNGIDWKKDGRGVFIDKAAKPILAALEIDAEDAVSVGLLASLGPKEFCVATPSDLTKRVLI